MGCIVKPLVWLGVAGTLAGGTALAIMGPHRAHALFNQARERVNSSVDGVIDDPIALRQQLRELESQYPGRIAEVRGDLAELTAQISQLDRELTVSERVVALADSDLNVMKATLTKAQEAQAAAAGIVAVRFSPGEKACTLDEAYGKARQVSELREAYSSRASDISRDLSVLRDQESRLSKLLAQLEAERSEFQAQLWQLDHQVDAIARNERMIEIFEKRQAAIDRHTRYEAASLDQVRGSIAKTIAEQESRLSALTTESADESYRARAETELDLTRRAGKLLLDDGSSGEGVGFEITPPVIEISPDEEPAPMASRDR